MVLTSATVTSDCIIVMCANNPDNPFHPSPSRTPPPPQTQPSTEDPSKTTDPDHPGMFDIDNDTGCAWYQQMWFPFSV
jgi:hypothetical protein